MSRIAVLGGGTSGLLVALVLARAGHAVTLVEKDPLPGPVSPNRLLEAWHRPGTPQAQLPHGFMGRARQLLSQRSPDLLATILRAGALDFPLAPYIPGPERLAGDEDLAVIWCRRPLLESQLWRAAEREAGLHLLTGGPATGLLADGVDPVRVRGLRLASGEDLQVDLVIDAAGRRSPVRGWLLAAGATLPPDSTQECGLIYYSRYYALRPGASFPRGPWMWGPRIELPFGMLMVHLADNGVFSISMAVSTREPELRAIRECGAFDAGAALFAPLEPWLAVATPISPVLAMGGLQNVLRPFRVDGAPIARGLVPLGDALCHTNAAYGWGVAMGMEHAYALGDALAAHGDDAEAVSLAYHARVWPEAEARWRVASEQDRARMRAWRGEPADDADTPHAAALRDITAASMADPVLFRALMRFVNLLDPSEVLLGDAALGASARSALSGAPAPPRPKMPTQDEFVVELRRSGTTGSGPLEPKPEE
ncbi:MAG: FAD-dependent oxidoreductase [Candidatus Eisenbacteria bacterium]